MQFLGESEWKRKKHGAEYRRQWRKLHIAIDAKTLQIRAVQLTTHDVSDSQVLEDLLAQIPLDEQIDSVYIDGAERVIKNSQKARTIPLEKLVWLSSSKFGGDQDALHQIIRRQINSKDFSKLGE